MQEEHILLNFQAKYCPGDMRFEKHRSAGVLGQLNEKNMECLYYMYMYFML